MPPHRRLPLWGLRRLPSLRARSIPPPCRPSPIRLSRSHRHSPQHHCLPCLPPCPYWALVQPGPGRASCGAGSKPLNNPPPQNRNDHYGAGQRSRSAGTRKQTMTTENGQLSAPSASRCYRAYGFDPCECEPDECERCKQVKPLYFGDRDYWDSREGSYLCGDCLDERIAADKKYAAHHGSND